MFDLDLSQLVLVPTHVKGGILDLILTSNDSLITNLNVVDVGLSGFITDHFLLHFEVVADDPIRPCNSPQLVYDYTKADWQGMCNHLLDCDFAACFESTTVEEAWAAFKFLVRPAMDIFIPKFSVRRRQFPPWFTKPLRHQKKCLQSLQGIPFTCILAKIG